MLMCRCDCVAFKEITFSPIRLESYVEFSWVRICRFVSCLAYIHEIALKSHLDDSASYFDFIPEIFKRSK